MVSRMYAVDERRRLARRAATVPLVLDDLVAMVTVAVRRIASVTGVNFEKGKNFDAHL